MLWSSSPTAVNMRALAGEQLEQLVLRRVGVLVLVDQQVAQRVLPLGAHLGVAPQQLHAAGRSGRRSRPPGRPRGAPRSAASRARRRARRRSRGSTCALLRPWFFHRLMAHCQRRASALSVLPPASFSTPSTSSLSRMLNCSFRPMRAPSPRRMRTPSEWKVLTTRCLAARGPTSALARSRISCAALLVKVIAAICPGA